MLLRGNIEPIWELHTRLLPCDKIRSLFAERKTENLRSFPKLDFHLTLYEPKILVLIRAVSPLNPSNALEPSMKHMAPSQRGKTSTPLTTVTYLRST